MNRPGLRTIGLLLGAALLLGACGQTGPLYLPERGEIVTRPATPTPSQPPAAPDPAVTPPASPTPPKR